MKALNHEPDCVECTRIASSAAALLRDLRAVSCSVAIVLSLLLVELVLVAIAHGAFGRFEDPTNVIAILAAGTATCIVLFVFARGGKRRTIAQPGDTGVLATLSGAGEVTCPRSHERSALRYVRLWLKSE